MEDKKQLEDKMRYLAENMKTLTMKLKKEQELLENARNGQMLEPGIAHIPHCPLSNLADIDPNCKVHGPLFTILKGIKKEKTSKIGKFTVPSPNQGNNGRPPMYRQYTEPNLLSTSTILTNVGLDSCPSVDTNLQSLLNTTDTNSNYKKSKVMHGSKTHSVKVPMLSKSWMTLLNEREADTDEDVLDVEIPSSRQMSRKKVKTPSGSGAVDKQIPSASSKKQAFPYYMPPSQKQRKIPDDTISKYLECYSEIENRNQKDEIVNKNMLEDSFSITNIDNEIMNLSRMVDSLTTKEE